MQAIGQRSAFVVLPCALQIWKQNFMLMLLHSYELHGRSRGMVDLNPTLHIKTEQVDP